MEKQSKKPSATKHPLYSTWSKMRERCYNKNHIAYMYYGGRGITVCDHWNLADKKSTGFWNFVADVGDKPGPSHTLDRIRSNDPYQPDNVRWATKSEQSFNRVFGREYVA